MAEEDTHAAAAAQDRKLAVAGCLDEGAEEEATDGANCSMHKECFV